MRTITGIAGLVAALVVQMSCFGEAADSSWKSCDKSHPCLLKVGKIDLQVIAIPSGISTTATNANFDVSHFQVFIDSHLVLDAADLTKKLLSANTTNGQMPQDSEKYLALSAKTIASTINSLNRGVVADASSPQPSSQSLTIRTTPVNAQRSLEVRGLQPQTGAPEASNWRNFVISIRNEDINYLRNDQTRVAVRLPDGTLVNLYSGFGYDSNPWTYISDRSPADPGRLLVMEVDKVVELGQETSVCPRTPVRKNQRISCDPSQAGSPCSFRPQGKQVSGPCGPSCKDDWFATDADSYRNYCSAAFVVLRRNISHDPTHPPLVGPEELAVGMQTTQDGDLEVNQSALADDSYSIDDRPVASELGLAGSRFRIASGSDAWLIEWFGDAAGCRPHTHEPSLYSSITVQPPERTLGLDRQNGITVGAAKIFDVRTLQRMLNDTASQLAGLSVFNGTQITGAVGSLQGITRDTSFLNAQVTTAPTAALTQSLSSGTIAPNTTQTTVPIGNTTVTLQCPDGSLPTIGSSTTLGGCAAAPVTGAAANVPAYSPISNSGVPSQAVLTTTPAGSTTTNSGSTVTTQNGSTTTNSSVAGVAPSALISNALATPNNVAAASSDILSEQVQLNAQLITLRMLLQGALSDQFLAKDSTAVALRRQTTLGFMVNLDPPRQFKHAIAEVRVIVEPPNVLDSSANPISLVNLLPAEKTYNVAKVTSHQSQFGAGAVVEPVAFGVTTGKAKDRLYIVKDTDTLALQFRPQATPIRTPFPEHVRDKLQYLSSFEALGGCRYQDEALPPQAIVFGWQFRPVLGQDYVTGGQRQVFAQLALPIDLQGRYTPKVLLQTRWREYNPKTQTVGPVFSDSCSSERDRSGVMLASKTIVDDMEIGDLGAGQIALKAKGQFYSTSLGVIAGASTLLPRTFDGKNVEIIAAAHDLMEAGELSILDPDGKTYPFAMSPNQNRSCGIVLASMEAVPYPDGNSRAELTIGLGGDYNVSSNADRPPHPLVMIGDGVYGLKETPFLGSGGQCVTVSDPDNTYTKCLYDFTAPTTALRNAQIFQVRDLTWRGFDGSDTIGFAPSFSAVAISKTSDTTTDSAVTVYSVSGFDFRRLQLVCGVYDKKLKPCLHIFIGDQEVPTNEVGFVVQSDNTATMSLTKAQLGKAKNIRFQVQWLHDDPRGTVEWALAVPKTDATKPSASPAFLRVGDSQKVSFTGGDLCKTAKQYLVTFEAQQLTATCSSDGTSLDVMVSTAVTKLFGHKELTVVPVGVPIKPGAPPDVLSIDVLRQ